MSRPKSATPKERVLAAYPLAHLSDAGGVKCIRSCFSNALNPKTDNVIGRGATAAQAWQDAAKRLRGKR